MANKYTVLESINMASTHYAERIFDCVATEDIENGTFGYLNGLADDQSHIYKFAKGTAEGEPIVVVDQPAWTEDDYRIVKQRRDQFIVKAGTPFRVRVIKENDEFGLTKEGFTSASAGQVAVGAYATIDSSTGKLVAQAEEPEAAPYFYITRKRIVGGTLATSAHNYGSANEMFELRVIG